MEPVNWPVSPATAKQGAPASPARADIETAAREFEGYLVGAMLRIGSRPLGGETLLDGGVGGRMYQELFYEEIARLSARGPGFGIADLLAGPERPERGPEGKGER